MAVNVEIFKLWVFTEILSLCVGQNTNMKNVALNKACDISSRYTANNDPPFITGTCSAAINGDTSTYLDSNRSPSNCINTNNEDTSPFWWVDLGQRFTINKMTIYGRKTYIFRMVCVNVSLDGIVIKRFNDTSGWTSDKYDLKVGRSGQVINITRDCKSAETDVPVINLCQVQVWTCDDGWYGDDCTQPCGHCTSDSVCDKMNGRCTSCQTGFQSPMCRECADGWYGTDCAQTCGNCGGNSVCDKTTGSCSSCTTRFNPPFCKECVPGWYGNNCNETCGHCLGGNSTCDKTTGSCPLCDGVFQPPVCKETCTDGWYGNSCTQTCGRCAGGSVCDKMNGNCTSCETGFQLPRCDVMISSTENKETANLAGPVAGAAFGCSVAFFIIGVITTMLFRRFRSQQPSSTRRSPDDIAMTRELGTSMPIPRPEEKPENPSDYSSTNLYDELKGPDDNNTSCYVNLSLPPTQ